MTPVSLDTLDQVQTETGEFKPAQQVAYGNLRNGYLPSQESWEHTENWIRIFPENEPSGWNATFSSIDWRLVSAPIVLLICPFLFVIFGGAILIIALGFLFFACAGDLASMGILGIVIGRLLWIFNP